MRDPFVLLVGGRSTEYHDSLNSYFAVRNEIVSSSQYKRRLSAIYYISQTGKVRLHTHKILPNSEVSLMSSGFSMSLIKMISRLIHSQDYVFSLLHGNEGEDGSFQGISKTLGIPSNFGNISSACITMSKWLMLLLAPSISNDLIHCPKTWVVSSNSSDEEIKSILCELNERPAVVKPNSLGSSILSRYFEPLTFEELKNQIRLIRPYDNQVLVQNYIVGTEYTCGVIGDKGKARALPVAEIRSQSRFFDYDEKHKNQSVELLFPKGKSKEIEEMKRASMMLFTRIGLSYMGRFDFIRSSEDGKIYFLEANSLPGLGVNSIFPRMLRQVNMSRLKLIDLCITNYKYHK